MDTMKSRKIKLLFEFVVLCLLALLILSFSSFAATDCVARVKGGNGTVADPLIIEVEGNAGLTPFLDSLLPYNAVPSIELYYVGERFYIPGFNYIFLGKHKLTKIIYLAAVLLFLVFIIRVVLRIAGKRVVLIDSL